jgi:hypothetical protein
MRTKTLERIQNDILTRVLDNGFVLVTDTSWYNDDPPHELAKRSDRWFSIKFDAMAGRNGASLWPEQWPLTRLEEKRLEIGQTAFDRALRNKPLSESMQYFDISSVEASVGRVKWFDSFIGVEPSLLPKRLVTGVDLATKKGQEHDLTVAATMTIDESGRFELLNLRSKRIEAAEILKLILLVYKQLHLPIIKAGGYAEFRVEDNAAQVYIIQMLKTALLLEGVAKELNISKTDLGRLIVRGHTTTANKRNLEYGIPGVAADFEMGRFDLPEHPETSGLIDEMRVWNPSDVHHTGDRLMAVWIARGALLTPQIGVINV